MPFIRMSQRVSRFTNKDVAELCVVAAIQACQMVIAVSDLCFWRPGFHLLCKRSASVGFSSSDFLWFHGYSLYELMSCGKVWCTSLMRKEHGFFNGSQNSTETMYIPLPMFVKCLANTWHLSDILWQELWPFVCNLETSVSGWARLRCGRSVVSGLGPRRSSTHRSLHLKRSLQRARPSPGSSPISTCVMQLSHWGLHRQWTPDIQKNKTVKGQG